MGQQGYFVAYGNDQVVILQAGYALFDIGNPNILFILTCLAVLRLYLPVDRIEVQFCKDKLGAVRGVSRPVGDQYEILSAKMSKLRPPFTANRFTPSRLCLFSGPTI